MVADIWNKISRRWTRPIDERKVKAEDSVVQRVIGNTDLPPRVFRDEYEEFEDDDL